jgi:hypothetical protein
MEQEALQMSTAVKKEPLFLFLLNSTKQTFVHHILIDWLTFSALLEGLVERSWSLSAGPGRLYLACQRSEETTETSRSTSRAR